MRGRSLVLTCALASGVVSACAGASTSTSSPAPSPHAGTASDYLLRLDELTLPGFTVAGAPAAIDPATLAPGDAAVATALRSAGVRSAAQAHYFRAVADLATANGPIDVTTAVVACGGAAAATAVRDALARHLDARPGATGVSTGPLGDGGHGSLVETVSSGVTVAQATLVWRAGDLVSEVVVGERDTGSPVQDALIVAAPQVRRQTA